MGLIWYIPPSAKVFVHPTKKLIHSLVGDRVIEFLALVLCIGCPKKKYSIKLKKKCTKKWRSPTRELKTWYVCNNIIVFLFMKKYFSILNFYGWYGHLNVKFWQFWHWPNVSKFCSKIVLCLLFLLQKKFPV